jgi:putative RecB family exonuclease
MTKISHSLKIDHLSASQLILYLQCSLKYRFQYLDKLVKPFKSAGLAFGSVIHSALDWFHRQKVNGNGATLEMLLKVFETDWFSQCVEADIRFKDKEMGTGLVVMGRQMLTQYFQTYKEMPVGAEIPFSLPLTEPVTGEVLGPNLEGRLDLAEKDAVVEFKTSAQTLNAQDLKDSLQLTCYGYAYRMLFHKEPRSFRVVDFVKTKTPKMVVLQATREEKDYRKLFYLAKEVLRGIDSGIFYPNPSFKCKDCEYEDPCQAWLGNENNHHYYHLDTKGGFHETDQYI